MEHAILVHSPEYANWVFDKTHPTQGRRFLHARNQLLLEAQKRRLNVWEIEPEHCSTDDLHLVHDMSYVFDVTVRGESTEWSGQRHDLGELAKLFVSGTLTALDTLIDKKTLLAINFAGAKHHAMPGMYVPARFVKGTNTLRYARYADLAVSTTVLTEGTAPTDDALTISSEFFTAAQYGATVAVSDLDNLDSPHDLSLYDDSKPDVYVERNFWSGGRWRLG